MTDKTRALLEQAKKLPEDEREKLAYEILQTVGGDEDPLSPEWRAEIERRIEDAVSGKSGPGLDWRKAMDEIRSEVEQDGVARGDQAHRPRLGGAGRDQGGRTLL